MAELLLALNLAVSGAVAIYMVRVEHRFTRLETQMHFLLADRGIE